MRKRVMFVISISVLVLISTFLIIAQDESKGGYLVIEPSTKESSEDTQQNPSPQEALNECEQQGGICKCGCDSETEFGGYGR
ncbi:MAG: hypothetical protein AABY14_04115, partial [Nanoarchaeota archaeon]